MGLVWCGAIPNTCTLEMLVHASTYTALTVPPAPPRHQGICDTSEQTIKAKQADCRAAAGVEPSLPYTCRADAVQATLYTDSCACGPSSPAAVDADSIIALKAFQTGLRLVIPDLSQTQTIIRSTTGGRPAYSAHRKHCRSSSSRAATTLKVTQLQGCSQTLTAGESASRSRSCCAGLNLSLYPESKSKP